jgi:hypothetical protein
VFRVAPPRDASRLAGVAQLVEQLIRNQQVIGSSPIAGSIRLRAHPMFTHATAGLRRRITP